MKIPSRRQRCKQRKKSINQRLLFSDLEIFLFLIQSNILPHIFIRLSLIDHSIEIIELLLFIVKIFFKMIGYARNTTGKINRLASSSSNEFLRNRKKKKNNRRKINLAVWKIILCALITLLLIGSLIGTIVYLLTKPQSK